MPYIGRGPGFGVRSRFIYTATAGQTSFSGNDDAGISLAYTDTLYMDVYQNGVLLVPATDYAASTGTSVVLVQGASVGDTVELLVYDIFSVADSVSAKDGGTFSGTIAAAGLSTSSLGTSNFRAGVNAGNSITAGGNYNVVVGDEAGTALTTGDDNVAIGFEALSTEDTGTRAVAVGYRALKVQNSDTTNYNVAVGYDAGLSVTTGTQNVFMGGKAGDALTVGDDNVAIGRAALTSDTQGSNSVAVGFNTLADQNFTSATESNNVAVGHNAGGAVTTGVQNTIVGSFAGDALTDADDNIALGHDALSSDTQGSRSVAIGSNSLKTQNFTSATNTNNTAVGNFAGEGVTTGTNGSFFGKGAGIGVTVGLDNTCIGKEAGTVITNGDYNVIIGSDSDTDNANAQSRIAIGFNVSNGTDNSVKIGSGGNFISNTFTSNATWAHSSDERLKENIEDDNLGLDFINDLRPVTFTWKRQADVPEELKSDERFEKDTGTHHGMIAQEVKAALDKAGVNTFTGWSTDDGDGTQMVSEDMFVYPLINALQELSEKNDALEARLAALEAK